jgi:hypothetical protein
VPRGPAAVGFVAWAPCAAALGSSVAGREQQWQWGHTVASKTGAPGVVWPVVWRCCFDHVITRPG